MTFFLFIIVLNIVKICTYFFQQFNKELKNKCFRQAQLRFKHIRIIKFRMSISISHVFLLVNLLNHFSNELYLQYFRNTLKNTTRLPEVGAKASRLLQRLCEHFVFTNIVV